MSRPYVSLLCWVQISNTSRQTKSQDEAANSQNRGTSPPWEDYANPGGRWWILPLTRHERTRCRRKIPGVTRSKIWALGSAAQKSFGGFRVSETSYILYEDKGAEERHHWAFGLEVYEFLHLGRSFYLETSAHNSRFQSPIHWKITTLRLHASCRLNGTIVAHNPETFKGFSRSKQVQTYGGAACLSWKVRVAWRNIPNSEEKTHVLSRLFL